LGRAKLILTSVGLSETGLVAEPRLSGWADTHGTLAHGFV
jgi:hypothetical protein